MPVASVNGVELSFGRLGEGEDLFLVHGLGANQGFWSLKLLLPLSRRFRVTNYDLRGHGYSAMPPSGYATEDMALDLLALLEHLEVERAHLVGHSFGGTVALHAAVLRPDRVASITIQDSRIRPLQPLQRLRDWPDWRATKEKLDAYGLVLDEDQDDVGIELLTRFASPEWAERRDRLAELSAFFPFSGRFRGGASAAEHWTRLAGTTTIRADVRRVDGLTRDALQALPHPTLALYGERSHCRPSYEALPEVLTDVRGEVIPGMGHFFPVMVPDLVAEKVLAFLDEVEQGSTRRGLSS